MMDRLPTDPVVIYAQIRASLDHEANTRVLRLDSGGDMKESSITNKILKYLRTIPNSWWMKNHGGPYGARGIPDISGHIKGKAVWIEVKKPGSELTSYQSATLIALKESGALATVAYNVDDVKTFVSCYFFEGEERRRRDR